MKVCVYGLWHLGCVTSACLASLGHEVVGLDADADVVAKLQDGKAPLLEPGLDALIASGAAQGRLRFTTDAVDALRTAEVLWVAFDTPVNERDEADTASVLRAVENAFEHLRSGALVLISSQLPVGTTARLEALAGQRYPKKALAFAYSPENLRLGAALRVFLQPDRIVVGVRSDADRARIETLLAGVKAPIEWMSVESAEMTKHALNAFLATSVAFANEIARLCELTGADAKDVERGLKSDQRIGLGAYLAPGSAFAGGTLARDIAFLMAVGDQRQQPVPLLTGVRASNDVHKHWIADTLRRALGELRGKKVAVWGLTYKPGTDTLRRSAAVELCEWLHAQGASPRVHDPAVKVLPEPFAAQVTQCADPLDALVGAQALVLATPWPVYRDVDPVAALARMAQPVVVDQNRFLLLWENWATIRYYAVGRPVSQ